jgi:hypothetical protein
MRKWLMMAILLTGSAFLTHWLPFSAFFRNLDTMIHELGHATMTLLLSGEVQYIYLYADHSGITLASLSSGMAVIPVALAGYVSASLFTVWMFKAYSEGKQRRALLWITVLSIIGLLIFVRNGFGMLWVAGFIGVNLVAVLLPWRTLVNVYFLLLAFLCLEQSVFGPISLWIYSLDPSANAGDATTLGKATGFGATVWASVFTIFALWCAKSAIQYFLGRKQRQRARYFQHPM